jgi:hypothetical protein
VKRGGESHLPSAHSQRVKITTPSPQLAHYEYEHLLGHEKQDIVVCLPLTYHDPTVQTAMALEAWVILRLYKPSLRP